MIDFNNYFSYLQQRSRAGLLYRQYWLYPRLSRCLQGKALDIGCGIGDFLSYRENTIGVDINEKTVGWCRAQGHSVELMQVDHLPCEDGSFDSVIMDNVLEHIEDPRPILIEAHRVLVGDGVLVIGVPGTLGYSRDPDHKVFYSKEKLVETVINAGFTEQKVFAMPLSLDWLDTRMSQYCVYGVFHRAENKQ